MQNLASMSLTPPNCKKGEFSSLHRPLSLKWKINAGINPWTCRLSPLKLSTKNCSPVFFWSEVGHIYAKFGFNEFARCKLQERGILKVAWAIASQVEDPMQGLNQRRFDRLTQWSFQSRTVTQFLITRRRICIIKNWIISMSLNWIHVWVWMQESEDMSMVDIALPPDSSLAPPRLTAVQSEPTISCRLQLQH